MSHVLALNLRPFQDAALAAIRSEAEAGEHRAHVVAPPGAGKTVIGLAWAVEHGTKTVVLCPTRTIAAQWVARARDFVSDPLDPRPWASGDAADIETHTLVAVTYQSMSVKERGTDELHGNVEELFDRFERAGVGLVILDECHHLLAHWAEALLHWRARAREAGRPFDVLGLTATPPIDAGSAAQRRYLEVVGNVSYEIPLPALVRDGLLAPYQDLAWLVQPTPREAAHLASAHARLSTLRERLREPDELLLSLPMWLQHVLDDRAAPTEAGTGWGDWLLEDPDAAISLTRVARSSGVRLPELAWETDEMLEPPELDDWIAALADYANRYLGPLQEGEVHPLGFGEVRREERDAAEVCRSAIRDALRPIGARLTRRGVQRHASALDRLLGLSASKLEALDAILRVEHASLGDDLRAVVVVDFERATRGRSVRELEGVLDPEAGGAVAVLRRLAADAELGDLEPVMLTGRNLICDTDVARVVAAALEAAAMEHGWRVRVRLVPDGPVTRIVGEGSDWNSSRYTLLVTELFERGVTRCIVGTRGLLGEGWDVRSANVLVDLTSVASFVSTNQLRGRCLRLDPARPEKVANLWDVVAIAPAHERGFADWDRFVRKHEHVFGVADDGAIERGVGHVHPSFAHVAPAELAGWMPAVRDEMRGRAADRPATRAAWAIGTPYRNETFVSAELRDVPMIDVMQEELPPGVAVARATAWVQAQQSHASQTERAERERAVALQRAAESDAEADRVVAAVEAAAANALVPLENTHARQRRRCSRWPLRAAVLAVQVGLVASVAVASGTVVAVGVLLAAIDAVSSARGARAAARALEEEREHAAREREAADARAAELRDAATRIRGAADEARAAAVAAAEASLAAAEQALTSPLKPDAAAALYADVLLDAFRRWSDTADAYAAAACRVGRRADGALHVELVGAPADATAVFAQGYRALVGPLSDPRYLLRCGPSRLEGAVAQALDARDRSTRSLDAAWDGDAVVAVPSPLDQRRSGADAFAAAWSERVGPCELVYTRGGEGAEIRERVARRRWWRARASSRTVWR